MRFVKALLPTSPYRFSPKPIQTTGDKRDRIFTALRCIDSDFIPKVPEAGKVLQINGQSVQIMHNGIKVVTGGYHGEWMTEIIEHLAGHHEPQEEKVFFEILKTIPSKGVMLELGAFWGYYSLWFNSQVKEARNILVEPIKEKLEVARKNFGLNSKVADFLVASIGKSSDDHASFLDWDGTRLSNIPRLCVEDLMDRYQVQKVHILHSDIQGAEYEMLCGAEKSILDGRIQYVFISTHGSMHECCLDWLRQHQFHIIASHNVEESFSADGLIVARHKKWPGVEHSHISRRYTGQISRLAAKGKSVLQRLQRKSIFLWLLALFR